MDRARGTVSSIVGALGLGWLALAATGVAQQSQVLNVPAEDVGIQTLKERGTAQLATLDRFKVGVDFSFRDQQADSGIDFLHRIVDDGGRYWKAVHYDHGNGITAADVDGDGLEDLYFTNQLGSNRLYRNLGEGRFVDITEAAGVAVEDRVSVAAAFADIDNDGDPDLYVTTVKMGNLLFENVGGTFRDVSEAAGVDYVGHSSGVVFFDADSDGLLDLLVINVGRYTSDRTGRGGYYIAYPDAFQSHRKPERNERAVFYENRGGLRFENMSETAGFVDVGWNGDASIVDLNQDGLPDVYITNMQGDDHYYENQGEGEFLDRTEVHFPKTPWGAMGIGFLDYNNDGLADLYVTDMHSDMAVEVGPELEKLKSEVPDAARVYDGSENNLLGNAFWVNQGEGLMKEVSDEVGAENYWPWGISTGDLNADGFEDVFVASSMNFPFRFGVNTVLINNAGNGFLDSEFILGIEPRSDGVYRTPWFDLDCSGLDVGHQYCGGRSGNWIVMGAKGTRSSILLDLEGDGDLDIVTSEFNDVPQILVSGLSEVRPVHRLEVRLRGTRSNRDGLGAAVTVVAGDRRFWQYNDGKSGYLSQGLLPLYFGLGDEPDVDRIEVLWPSGARQVLEGPIALGRIEIVEPTA